MIALIPEQGAEGEGSCFVALNDEPWLRLDVDATKFSKTWIEIVYDLGLTDRVVRPILQFRTQGGVEEVFLPGAALGRGIWRGRAPAGCVSLAICPVDVPGPFAFRVVALRALSLARVVAYGAGKPQWLFNALQNFVTGDFAVADRCLRRAATTNMSDSEAWAKTRRRVAEPFDAPRRELPHLRSLAFGPAAPESAVKTHIADLNANDWFWLASPDIVWENEAAATILSEAARNRALDLIYVDERTTDGALRLKPDWSPALASGRNYIGAAWAARVGWALSEIGDWSVEKLSREGPPWPKAHRVGHVRRPLATAADVRAWAVPVPRLNAASRNAAVIIPTRDRADLLERCVASLRDTPAGAEFDILVVDNGSTEPRALAFLDRLRRTRGGQVLSAPGEFNFSALCNAAAETCATDALVFLNNDTEARSAGWLAEMLKWTSQPAVGAVGARLLFPDGRIQHDGVVLGIDGHANHFERFHAADDPGYFRRAGVAYEVSAVTGACLAVTREKFWAVGGFDAVHFPVEFSDIDLCLRLRERGWGSLMQPAAVLTHHEAASRKVWRSQERRYARQVATFKSRWRKALRDDPYFHPALSLDWHFAALDPL